MIAKEPQLATFDVAPPPDAALRSVSGLTGTESIHVATPQIAYSYSYVYRLPDNRIDAVQIKHLALCDKLGPLRCRVAQMKRSTSDDNTSEASLNLLVDAKIARNFTTALDKAVAGERGENVNREVEAEDLSKQIIDTQARIKAKQALADRLLAIIENRSGPIADLVAAERAFADAQEELDSARSLIADLRGRVALSKVDINYVTFYSDNTLSRPSFARPVRDAVELAGEKMGQSIAALITFVAVTLPWLLGIIGLLWIKRRLGWRLGLRWPWKRRKSIPDA